MITLFSNKGKSTRLEFWVTCLGCMLFLCITGPMVDMIGTPVLRDFSVFGLIFISCWILGCVTRKRCRDLGISRWKQFDPRYCLDIPFRKGRD